MFLFKKPYYEFSGIFSDGNIPTCYANLIQEFDSSHPIVYTDVTWRSQRIEKVK